MIRAPIFVLAAAVACSAALPRARAPNAAAVAVAVATAAPVPAPVARPYAPTSFSVTVAGRPHGRPIILIPGLGCPGSVWADTVAHFPDAETHVLTLAGFAGQAPISTPLSATVRAELAIYIRDRHLEHPIIIGHSLGGFIAFWLAAAEPDLVGPTITVDAFLAKPDL